MEIFIGIKNDIRGLGLLPIDHPFSKFISITQHFLIFGLIFSDFASPLWSCIFEAETFIQYVEAALPITASFLSALAYCRLIWKREIIIGLIREYELMIAQRKKLSFYQQTNEKVEEWTKKKNTGLMIMLIGYLMPSLIFFIYEHYFGDSSDQKYHLILPGSYPFDTKTPMGYTAAMVIQFGQCSAAIFVWLCSLWFPIAHCMFLVAFATDLQNELQMLNGIIEIEDGEKKVFSRNTIVEIKKKIWKIIQFHCDAKQIAFKTSSEAYFISISLIFLMSLMYCCINFLLINMYMKSNTAVEILAPFFGVLIWLILLFLLCDYGDKATKQFASLGNSYFGTLWYYLPVDQQKYFILMISNAEKTVYLEGFVVQCTRETFKKFMNTVYSYFMLLQKFY